MGKKKLAVFASGSGTNFEAIAQACADGRLDAEVALMVCDQPGAAVVARAERFGVPAFVASPKEMGGKAAFEAEIVRRMDALGINPAGAKKDAAPAPVPAEGDPFAGRTVVVTGTFHDLKRRDLEKALAARGAKVTGSVSGATSLLVVGANPGADKTAAARRFGTPTMDEKALREALGLPPVVEQASLF